jgi:4-amino-4-deoxy-L-arabinose transferase-like glycosyltransferase
MPGYVGVPWRAMALAAVVGVLLRLAFSLGYWNDKPLTRDEHEYLSLARSLSAGHGFVYDDVMRTGPIEPFGRAPGYPAFLAAVGGGRAPATSVPVAVDVAQSLMGALGIVMVGLFAWQWSGRAASRAAAWLAAVHPPLVWVSGYAMSEAVFWPLALVAAWLVDHASARGRPGTALAAGVTIGLGVLIRPALVFFVPFAALLLVVRRDPRDARDRFRARALAAAALVAGVMVVVGPWTARNYLHHGRLMFVASEGGVTFWTGNHPLAIGEGDMAANEAIKRDNLRLRAEHPGVSEDELEPIFYREAFNWIAANPVDWVALEFRKLFYLIVPIGPSYTLHSPRYLGLSVAAYLTTLSLAVLGLLRARPLGRASGLWALVASAVLTALVFFPQERFRIPIIDPALVVLAGAGLASLRPFTRPS